MLKFYSISSKYARKWQYLSQARAVACYCSLIIRKWMLRSMDDLIKRCSFPQKQSLDWKRANKYSADVTQYFPWSWKLLVTRLLALHKPTREWSTDSVASTRGYLYPCVPLKSAGMGWVGEKSVLSYLEYDNFHCN